MFESFNISKFNAAERQLKEAIRLVIQGRDPISTHTLACSAHQILYDLAQKHGISSNIKDIVPNPKKKKKNNKTKKNTKKNNLHNLKYIFLFVFFFVLLAIKIFCVFFDNKFLFFFFSGWG